MTPGSICASALCRQFSPDALGAYSAYHYGLFGFAIFQGTLQSFWLLAFFHIRKPEGLRVFAPLREPLMLSVALVMGNLLVVRSMLISSIYRLAILLAVEGVICAFFLMRMVMSWEAATGSCGSRTQSSIGNTRRGEFNRVGCG